MAKLHDKCSNPKRDVGRSKHISVVSLRNQMQYSAGQKDYCPKQAGEGIGKIDTILGKSHQGAINQYFVGRSTCYGSLKDFLGNFTLVI